MMQSSIPRLTELNKNKKLQDLTAQVLKSGQHFIRVRQMYDSDRSKQNLDLAVVAERNAKKDKDALASFRQEMEQSGYVAEYCGEPLGQDNPNSNPPPPPHPRIVPYQTLFY